MVCRARSSVVKTKLVLRNASIYNREKENVMIEPLKGANQLIFHEHLHMREKKRNEWPDWSRKKNPQREIRRLIVKK